MSSEQQTARQRIEKLLDEYGMWVAGDIYRKRNFEDDAEAVDEVIAIVREALLSEGAIEEAEETGAINHIGRPGKSEPLVVYLHRGEEAVKAALDTAFGEEAEQ